MMLLPTTWNRWAGSCKHCEKFTEIRESASSLSFEPLSGSHSARGVDVVPVLTTRVGTSRGARIKAEVSAPVVVLSVSLS